jgi:hypothetical protein
MNFDYFDKIDRYARGSMIEAERQEFEQLLKSDPQLAQEWEDYSLIANSVRNSIRTKALGTKGYLLKLVEDARDLAKENGLLLTVEDIWDYLRGTVAPFKKDLIERRKKMDPGFRALIESEQAIISGIQLYSAGAKRIQKAQQTLQLEGFPDKVHQQILLDISQEKKINETALKRTSPTNETKLLSALAFITLIIFAVLLFILFYT